MSNKSSTKQGVKLCPFCRSKRPLVKAGFLTNRTYGYRRQRYVCMKCHRFTVKPKEVLG